ncbi:hypothetical protein DICVIV_03188 [Dictyocaulus viviparus]|uniref:Receptor L-domain domain-containing protein n=1 Tax=Dictyocaulus viviparus TaxID=29172 RepID=A0A0D8Y1C9_DICVI|nr:hypothetical protein DICVIV_03188 [Dictyocaulus viviparus]
MIWSYLFVSSVAVIINAYDECVHLPNSDDWEKVVSLCKGRDVIGKNSSNFTLYAIYLTENEFNEFLSNAVEVTMCIVVENTNFETLRFPNVKKWVSCNTGLALQVRRNNELKTISFNKEVKFSSPNSEYVAEIRGNRKLTQDTISSIAVTFSSYQFFMPRYGECSLPDQIDDLSLLNCDAYYGNLAFTSNVDGETPLRGGIVDGCLKIKDTYFTDIDFIRAFNFSPSSMCMNEISGNPFLCLSKNLEEHLSTKMDIMIYNNMDSSCRLYVDRLVVFSIFMGTCFIVLSFVTASIKIYISSK